MTGYRDLRNGLYCFQPIYHALFNEHSNVSSLWHPYMGHLSHESVQFLSQSRAVIGLLQGDY